MNVDELVEAMHAVSVPSEPDLVRIGRSGRRIVARRRIALAAGVATVVALVAVPSTMLGHDRPHGAGSPTGVSTSPEGSAEHKFETVAPLGVPVGAVADVDSKFYVRVHGSSVGALALWSEARNAPDEIAYGARLIDGDGSLRRAGYVRVPVLPAAGGQLARVPSPQGTDEPTYVGLVPLPSGAAADDYRIRVRSTDTSVSKGGSADVVAGKLLIWISATDGSEPGIDLESFTVRDAAGEVVATGSFQH